MKHKNQSIEKFLRNGSINDSEEYDDLEEELETKHIQPMRSTITRNKKEEASVYKNSDSKRYKK